MYLQLRNDSSAHALFSEKSLTLFWYALQRTYPNLIILPFRCLLLFVSTYLCEQGWVFREANEKQSPSCALPFFQRCHGYSLRVSHLNLSDFFGHKLLFLNKKSQFGHNFPKDFFSIHMRQITKKSQ